MPFVEWNGWAAAKHFSQIGFNILHHDENVVQVFTILFTLDDINKFRGEKIISFVFCKLTEKLDFTYSLFGFVETVTKHIFY